MILETFESWIRLALPDELFENLIKDCPSLIAMVFNALHEEDSEDLTTAVNCMIELIIVSQKNGNYQEIKQTVIEKVDSLQVHVKQVVEGCDFERANQYAEIFVELARGHINQIVNEGSAIVEILVSIFEMEESDSRIQTSFWCDLFRAISKCEDSIDKMLQFKPILARLLEVIVKRSKMDEETFILFNEKPKENSDFDDLFETREPLGYLVKNLCKYNLCF